ncbi:MAG: ABC transporter permease [Lachnospiraceae bacterium]|nr:ABC transporter permease [Lachnospiraceae bacterium]
MLQIIWLEIKEFLVNDIRILLLSAIAFTFSCIAINITVSNYTYANKEQNAMEESYGEKKYYKINLPGNEEVFSSFFSGENAENIKNAFEQLNAEQLFDYRYMTEDGVDFFSENDTTYGKDDFPLYPEECIDGYEEGNPMVFEDYLRLKCILADHLFKTESNVKLSEGEWFTDDEFYVRSLVEIHLPIVLGSAYKDMYNLGDTLTNAHIATEESITLEVVGFFEEDSYFYNNNNEKIFLNRYIVVPSMETTYDDTKEEGKDNLFFEYAYDSTKIMNARIVCNQEDVEEVGKKVKQIFKDNKLYELRLVDESDGAKKLLEDARSSARTSMIMSILVIIFSMITYGVQMYYKIFQNKRKYGVFMLNGITKKQLVWFILADMLVVMVFANILYVVFSVINSYRGFGEFGLTMNTLVVIFLMEITMLSLMGVFGLKAIEKIELSMLLRDNE